MREDSEQTLREALVESFDEGGLRALTHDLGFNYDNLPVPSQSTSNKALALIEACRQNGRIPDLLERCEQLRPNVNWPAKKLPVPVVAAPSAAPSGARRWLPLVGIVVLAAVAVVAFLAFQFGRADRAPSDESPAALATPAAGSAETRAPQSPAASQNTSRPEPTAVSAANSAGALPTFTSVPALPEAVNLTDNPGRSDWPVLGLDAAGVLHLIWTDNSLDAVQDDLFQRRLGADGRWSDPVLLTGDIDLLMGRNGQLRLHPDGNLCAFVHAARVLTNPGTLGLYQTCEQAGQWPGAQQLATVDDGRGRSYQPIIRPDGQVQTGYMVSSGTYFFETTELTEPAWQALEAVTVVDGSGRYHTFMVRIQSTYSLTHRYSDDGGQTWSELETLFVPESSLVSALTAAGTQDGVHSLVVNNGCLYDLAWTADTGWSDPVDITAGICDHSATSLGLAIDANGLAHVVWLGRGVIWFAQQTAPNAWTPPRVVADANGSGAGPEIVIDAAGTRHIVWADTSGNQDIFYVVLPPE